MNHNTYVAQYIAGKDGRLADNIISTWSAMTVFVVSVFTLKWIKTEPESHSERGWKLSTLWPRLTKEMIGWLAENVPGFPARWNYDKREWTLTRDGVLFFSAASRMGGEGSKPGTRFIMADSLLDHPERWNILGKRETPFECWRSFMACFIEVGKAYDWYGILGFGVPVSVLLSRLGRKIWYCSEVVFYSITGKIKRISPRRLGAWLETNGWDRLGDGSVLTQQLSNKE